VQYLYKLIAQSKLHSSPPPPPPLSRAILKMPKNQKSRVGISNRARMTATRAGAIPTLPDNILNPAVPWDENVDIRMKAVNRALKYRYKCMPPNGPNAKKFEIRKRDWVGSRHLESKVVDAPIHYREFVMDLNWNMAFLGDMFGVAKWPKNCKPATVMRALIVYLSKVRDAFIDEVSSLGDVSRDWRSKTLDSIMFTLYFKSRFGYLSDLRSGTEWYSECKPGGTLDIFQLGDSFYCSLPREANNLADWPRKRQSPGMQLCCDGEEYWDRKCMEAVREGMKEFETITGVQKSNVKGKAKEEVIDDDITGSDSDGSSELESDPEPKPKRARTGASVSDSGQRKTALLSDSLSPGPEYTASGVREKTPDEKDECEATAGAGELMEEEDQLADDASKDDMDISSEGERCNVQDAEEAVIRGDPTVPQQDGNSDAENGEQDAEGSPELPKSEEIEPQSTPGASQLLIGGVD
jgi:hypothetical protein